jgi:hypothetical protein
MCSSLVCSSALVLQLIVGAVVDVGVFVDASVGIGSLLVLLA